MRTGKKKDDEQNVEILESSFRLNCGIIASNTRDKVRMCLYYGFFELNKHEYIKSDVDMGFTCNFRKMDRIGICILNNNKDRTDK